MKHRNGFTLIEALAATALAAIMMTAVMSVVSAIARSDKASGGDVHDADWRGRVIQVIRRDLQHADEVQSLEDRVILTGYVSLDRETLKPTHRPAVVTYAINQYAGKSWLLRTQTDLESRSLHNAWTQVVCSGVRGLAVSTQSGVSEAGPSDALLTEERGTDNDQTNESLAVPMETARLTLTWTQAKFSESSSTLLIR